MGLVMSSLRADSLIELLAQIPWQRSRLAYRASPAKLLTEIALVNNSISEPVHKLRYVRNGQLDKG